MVFHVAKNSSKSLIKVQMSNLSPPRHGNNDCLNPQDWTLILIEFALVFYVDCDSKQLNN